MWLVAIISHQIFAHALTAQLSCHVKDIPVVTVLEAKSKQKSQFSIEIELRWKTRQWNGSHSNSGPLPYQPNIEADIAS